MAREIHDTLAQGLIGIISQQEAVQQSTDRPGGSNRDSAARLFISEATVKTACCISTPSSG
jgi:signal transduction histidine kinase